MNTEINQKISQFLDDELHHTELENLLLTMKQQPDIHNKINRYQAVSNIIKTDEALLVNVGFLEKINQELKDEPHYFLPKKVSKKKQIGFWQKTSVAIAASVVGVAVIITQQTEIKTPDSQQLVAQTQTSTPSMIQPILQAEAVQVKDVDKLQPSQHERLKAYLQAHSNDLYTHGSLNIHPLARVAGYAQD
ncbi:MAG: sigma-E factor negative regulatory protein [Methylococcaceae bacterium]